MASANRSWSRGVNDLVAISNARRPYQLVHKTTALRSWRAVAAGFEPGCVPVV